MDSPLDAAAEPRLKKGSAGDAPKADHPLFWAGYLLVDSGSGAALPDPVAPPPKLELKPPAAAVK
jgi:hypothetical protein